MCEKAVDAYLPALEYVLYWSVTPWMLEIIDNPGLDNLIAWLMDINNARYVKKDRQRVNALEHRIH